MALTHLLDASVYSQPLKRQSLPQVMQHWQFRGEHCLAVSAICEAELLQGLYYKNSPQLWKAYEFQLKGKLPVLSLDSAVAAIYGQRIAESRATGRPRPELDLLIAATALAHELILATLNPKDFEYIEGLIVEDWSR
jgi:predicted nucleic acid-binding protein